MNTTSDNGLFEKSVYVGINLQDILYGVELVLYFMTMYTLLGHPGAHRKFYAIFSSVMLLLTTTWISMQAYLGEEMWVLDPNYPGGPYAFWMSNISNWYMDLATASLILLQLMTDGLMVYRCYILWNSYCVIIVPSILWAGTLALGILVCWSTSVSGGLYFHVDPIQLCLAYYSISAALTVMLTILICYRLVRHGLLIKPYLGHKYASTYFAIVAIVVESMLPYTLTCIAFLISLGIGTRIVTAFGYVSAPIMCISPQMLILRVAMRLSDIDTCMKQPPSATVEFCPQLEDIGSEAVSEGSKGFQALFSQSSPRGGDDRVV